MCPDVPRSLGMARRVVEERVPSPAPFAGFAPIKRPRVADDRRSAGRNRRNQRPRGIERERGAPRFRCLVGPGHGHGIVCRRDGDRPRPQLARIERDGLRRGQVRERERMRRIRGYVFSLFVSYPLSTKSTFHFLLSTFYFLSPSTPQTASAWRRSSGTRRQSIRP